MSFWNCESINYAVVKCIIVSYVALNVKVLFDFFFLQVLHHLVHQLGWPPLVTCLTAIFPSLSHWMYNHIVGKLLLMLHVNLEEVWKVINILLNWMVYWCTSLSKHPTWKKLLQRYVHILNSGIQNVINVHLCTRLTPSSPPRFLSLTVQEMMEACYLHEKRDYFL